METAQGEEGRRTEEEGSGREAGLPVSEAFRCHGANLLPVTKFIGSGLFIKCLGQVDLPGAPLYITHRQPSPPGSAGLPSAPGGCGCGRLCGGAGGWRRVWGEGLLWEVVCGAAGLLWGGWCI